MMVRLMPKSDITVFVTGAGGFIGSNFVHRLAEDASFTALCIHRDWSSDALCDACARADAVVHVAGVNRSNDDSDFVVGNEAFTEALVDSMREHCRPGVPLIFASTTQAGNETVYGRTKEAAERHVQAYGTATGSPVAIYRLPNIFGKWCKPNYNSVVATFCHALARSEPVRVHDAAAPLTLVHVDDVVDAWLQWLRSPVTGTTWPAVAPEYSTTVGELAAIIRSFREWRHGAPIGSTGSGFIRALYSTFLSYVPAESLCVPLRLHGDPRGVFAELFRTEISGQISFLTSGPGVTRGGHYHHTKIERFVVVRGQAVIRMNNIRSGEHREFELDGAEPHVVEMPPGWAHEIENTGHDDMLCILWANELFDPGHPDTHAMEIR